MGVWVMLMVLRELGDGGLRMCCLLYAPALVSILHVSLKCMPLFQETRKSLASCELVVSVY